MQPTMWKRNDISGFADNTNVPKDMFPSLRSPAKGSPTARDCVQSTSGSRCLDSKQSFRFAPQGLWIQLGRSPVQETPRPSLYDKL